MIRRYNQNQINELVAILKNDGVISVPTDTVYGIMGDALNEKAINKVYEAKKRDYSKSLLLLVSDKLMLNNYVYIENKLEQELIDKYLPGKLTILLKKKNNISDLITNHSEYVGIRHISRVEIR